ncbi:VENN motif pre-toxin domain-containing protein [Pasteurella testudinis]|uniref:VENN motif pre-toxin domain-containing protein n=1 Tax=Pasteurella testudinis TaxID=761 RepID=UPI0040589DF7
MLNASTIYGKSASELDERERQNISALSSLSGALAATVTAQADGTATDSTTTLVNAATGQAIAESAVENNALLNLKGESYLRAEKEKALVQLLKENGVKTTEDFVEAYQACKTDNCRQQIEAQNSQASAESLEIIKQLAERGTISRNDYTDLISTILPKMAQGALITGREIANNGGRLYHNDVSGLVGTYASGGDFNTYKIFDEKSLRNLGYEGAELEKKLKDIELQGNAWETGVVIGRGVNNIELSGTPKTNSQYEGWSIYLHDLPINGRTVNYNVSDNKLITGEFSIIDWNGYPNEVPKPNGPFRLISGDEYNLARREANKINSKLRRENDLVGKSIDIHEIKPIKFGGSPSDEKNKIFLDSSIHRKDVTPWWNRLQKNIEERNNEKLEW